MSRRRSSLHISWMMAARGQVVHATEAFWRCLEECLHELACAWLQEALIWAQVLVEYGACDTERKSLAIRLDVAASALKQAVCREVFPGWVARARARQEFVC